MNASIVFSGLAIVGAGMAIATLAIPFFAGIATFCTGSCVAAAFATM